MLIHTKGKSESKGWLVAGGGRGGQKGEAGGGKRDSKKFPVFLENFGLFALSVFAILSQAQKNISWNL